MRVTGRWASIAMAVLGAVFTLISTLLGYVDDRFFDADAFAGLMREALDEPDVRNYIADETAAQILLAAPDAAVTGSAIRDLTATLLEADFAQGIVEAAARDLHRAALDDKSDTTTLFISDLAVTVRAQLLLIDPELGALIPEDLNDVALELGSGERFVGLAQLADRVGWLASAATILAVLALILTVLLDGDRWRGAGHAGVAVAAAGGVTLVALRVGDGVLASYTEGREAGRAIDASWQIATSDLVPWGWTLIGVGGLTCAVAWSLLRAAHVVTPYEAARDFLVGRRGSPMALILRAVFGIVLAFWLIADPVSLIALIGTFAGIVLGIVSARELLRISGAAERFGSLSASAPDRPIVTRRSALALGAIAVLALAALASVATTILVRNDTVAASAGSLGCNGHVELCPRRLDQIAIAATHNSMSAAEDNFLLANHTRGMLAQLDAGFRGLLIDTWYGQAGADGPVLTTDPSNDGIDPETLAAAERIRERITGTDAETDVYLCHGFCEIGALDAVAELTRVRDWVEANPREVLIFFVQDMTHPADTAAVFEASGLSSYAFVHQEGTPLPTLDEMIATGRTLFVMVEEDRGEIPWLHDGFTYTQETPFSFASEAEFTCDENRGTPQSPLFQVNHFITPALGRNGTVNELEVLLPRLEECWRERGLLPNLIAVDFWEQGDAVVAADRLNGVG